MGHGNHWECLEKPADEALKRFLPPALAAGKVLASVNRDGMWFDRPELVERLDDRGRVPAGGFVSHRSRRRKAFAINCHRIQDVGGVEKHPSPPYPFSSYAKNPGFHLDTKAAVAADLSQVEVICEFFVHGERYHPELRLNFAELERSADGDGRYAIFSDAEDCEIAVDVLWGSDSVLWRVALPSGKEELAFLREKYAEVIQDARKWAYHTERRARIAIARAIHDDIVILYDNS